MNKGTSSKTSSCDFYSYLFCSIQISLLQNILVEKEQKKIPGRYLARLTSALGNNTADYNSYFVMTNDINMAGEVYSNALIAPDIFFLITISLVFLMETTLK